MTKVIVANSASYFDESIIEPLMGRGYEVLVITERSSLILENLKVHEPLFIFFMHWSYIIPKEIHDNFECIIFHMTDLPFGRGGSPLQNLISRGITQTKISAIQCVSELDAGDVYLKKSLSLTGSAQEIYLEANKIIVSMILEILEYRPATIPQEGKVTQFKRRTPQEGNLSGIDTLAKIFDHIRMLDADGYPRAYIETESLYFEFERASMRNGEVIADVRIRTKECQRK